MKHELGPGQSQDSSHTKQTRGRKRESERGEMSTQEFSIRQTQGIHKASGQGGSRTHDGKMEKQENHISFCNGHLLLV